MSLRRQEKPVDLAPDLEGCVLGLTAMPPAIVGKVVPHAISKVHLMEVERLHA